MGAFEEYLRTVPSSFTRENYRRMIARNVTNPDAFLETVKKDRVSAEMHLIQAMARNGSSGTHKRTMLRAFRSYLNFYEVPLNWKKVFATVPPGRVVGSDRAPTTEEIAKLIEHCDLRQKTVVLIMASSGIRIGAWAYMDLSDIIVLKEGFARLRVYKGEPEQYSTFISPEAVQALGEYLEHRKRAGEETGPASPVIRNLWRSDVRRVKKVTPMSVQLMLWYGWQAAGFRQVRDHKRKEFKQAHGFRKFFKSNFPVCPIHGQLDAEILMGHSSGIESNYFKPTESHLAEIYAKAVPFLSIDEKYHLKEQLQTQEIDHSQKWDKVRLENLEMKTDMAEIKALLKERGMLLKEKADLDST